MSIAVGSGPGVRRGRLALTPPAIVLLRILDFATGGDSGLSSSEVLAVLKSLMDNSADGCDTVLNFVQRNRDSIEEK